MPFVSITRLRVRAEEFVEPFFTDAVAADGQARSAQGNLGAEVLGDANDTYWTKTMWVNRAAMRVFVSAGGHRESMPRLRVWCDEAHVAHWEQAADELPSWTEAHRRLISEGRPSPVDHPTPAHESMDIPPPAVPS